LSTNRCLSGSALPRLRTGNKPVRCEPQDASSSENDVFVDINLYLKRDSLPMSIDHFNGRLPQGRMIVQTDLAIEGCLIEETVGSVMVIHMDRYDRLAKGLLDVYFIYSVYQPMNLSILIKSSEFHFRSSSDLFRKAFVGLVSHPELQYNYLVKVYDAVYKMMCRVAASQPRKNCVHIDMLPSVWIMIKRYLLE
jgi:hypothetical protein